MGAQRVLALVFWTINQGNGSRKRVLKDFVDTGWLLGDMVVRRIKTVVSERYIYACKEVFFGR